MSYPNLARTYHEFGSKQDLRALRPPVEDVAETGWTFAAGMLDTRAQAADIPRASSPGCTDLDSRLRGFCLSLTAAEPPAPHSPSFNAGRPAGGVGATVQPLHVAPTGRPARLFYRSSTIGKRMLLVTRLSKLRGKPPKGGM